MERFWFLFAIGSLAFLIYRYNQICRKNPGLNRQVYAFTLALFLIVFIVANIYEYICAAPLFVIYLIFLLKTFFDHDKILALSALITVVASFNLMLENISVFSSFFLLAWLAFIFTVFHRKDSANSKALDGSGRRNSSDSENDRNVRLPVKAERRELELIRKTRGDLENRRFLALRVRSMRL